jgi:hypothetical protein
MFLPDQTKHQYSSVIVNRPALQAWLHAWTTGESFPSPTSPLPRTYKQEKLDLALLRRLRSKTLTQTKP